MQCLLVLQFVLWPVSLGPPDFLSVVHAESRRDSQWSSLVIVFFFGGSILDVLALRRGCPWTPLASIVVWGSSLP